MLVLPHDPNAVPDHAATPPGNQELFIAGEGSLYGPGCDTDELYKPTPALWTSSDLRNVTISSANDATNGVATCLGTTNAQVTATLTAYGFTESESYPIACK